MIQVKARKRVAVAQRRVLVAVEFIREIHHTFASIVEFQPDLVIMKIARLYNMPGCVLISGQLVPLFRDVDGSVHAGKPGLRKMGRAGVFARLRRSKCCFGCVTATSVAATILADTFAGPFGSASLCFHRIASRHRIARPVWVVAGCR